MAKEIKYDPAYISTKWLDLYTGQKGSTLMHLFAMDVIDTWEKVCEKENKNGESTSEEH